MLLREVMIISYEIYKWHINTTVWENAEFKTYSRWYMLLGFKRLKTVQGQKLGNKFMTMVATEILMELKLKLERS
jgi:hypothetical protein